MQDLQQIGAEELAVLPFGENGICRRGSQRVDDGSLGVVVGHAGTIELAKEPTLLFRHAAGLCRVVHRHLVCMRGVEQALDVLQYCPDGIILWRIGFHKIVLHIVHQQCGSMYLQRPGCAAGRHLNRAERVGDGSGGAHVRMRAPGRGETQCRGGQRYGAGTKERASAHSAFLGHALGEQVVALSVDCPSAPLQR
ncbi:Uncharacterised protein [Mycobacteroides abscessus subsp. abscessus]|nr:Uncharacterised protein [Mycobacteroides abscessus subsp. abscessus]